MPELLTELLARCHERSPQAIATLVARFSPSAIDFATALLRDQHLAEDAVQNAFVTTLARLADLREPQAFPGWFRQIVRTESNRIARRRNHAATLIEDQPSHACSPAKAATDREHQKIVREALAALPRAGRQAAELFYLDELNTAEIAERLAIPRGTVKRRLHDARNKLRENLRNYIDPPPPI